MPSQEVKEEGREGQGKTLLFNVALRACPQSPADQAGQAGW